MESTLKGLRASATPSGLSVTAIYPQGWPKKRGQPWADME